MSHTKMSHSNTPQANTSQTKCESILTSAQVKLQLKTIFCNIESENVKDELLFRNINFK